MTCETFSDFWLQNMQFLSFYPAWDQWLCYKALWLVILRLSVQRMKGLATKMEKCTQITFLAKLGTTHKSLRGWWWRFLIFLAVKYGCSHLQHIDKSGWPFLKFQNFNIHYFFTILYLLTYLKVYWMHNAFLRILPQTGLTVILSEPPLNDLCSPDI